MKKILLHGAFFGSNYGDYLFCEIFKEKIEIDSILLMGKTGKYIKERMNLKGIDNELIQLLRTDAVVFSPGGYFGEPNSKGIPLLYWRLRMIFKHAYLGVMARLLGKPYAIIGIGVGPIKFELGKWVIKYIFNGARYVTVRDNESYKYLIQMDVDNPNISLSVDSILCMGNKLLDEQSVKGARELIREKQKVLLLQN